MASGPAALFGRKNLSANMTPRLLERYRKDVVPALQKEFQLANAMAVPTISKIVLNVGFGKHLKDPKHQETALSTLTRISGQKPVTTAAKKSIAAFKIRAGLVIGAKVTLRGARMWEFLDKFINITLPRVRDFHGIDPKGFGKSGVLTVGLRENVVFPEIRSDEVEHIHGLEISIVTSAKSAPLGKALLTQLGFPFSSSTR